MTTNQVTSAKVEALESLGRLLPSYAELQEQYSSRVNLQDYRFSAEREASLYRPIRTAVLFAIDRRDIIDRGALLNCPPGPHTPLLHEDGDTSLAARFEKVALLDIDAALESAKNTVGTLAADADEDQVLAQLCAELDIAGRSYTQSVNEILRPSRPDEDSLLVLRAFVIILKRINVG